VVLTCCTHPQGWVKCINGCHGPSNQAISDMALYPLQEVDHYWKSVPIYRIVVLAGQAQLRYHVTGTGYVL